MQNLIQIALSVFELNADGTYQRGHYGEAIKKNLFPFFVSTLAEFLETVQNMKLYSIDSLGIFDGIDVSTWGAHRLAQYQNAENGRFAFEARGIGRVLCDWIEWPSALATRVWIYREHDRLAQGRKGKESGYRALPSEAIDGLEIPETHFLHVSVKNDMSDNVAYTETADKGIRDTQSSLRFGRYLKKFFPNLSDEDIQSRVLALRAANTPVEYVLHFTEEPDKITEIFETRMGADGQSEYASCMYGKFSGTKRPYHVYANSPDVNLAYMTEKGADDIIARSVCRKDQNTFVRIYTTGAHGENSSETLCTIFENLLSAQGYSEGNLDGARLSKVGMRMPYLDGGANGINDDGQYWRVTDDNDGAEYTAQEQDGTMSENEDGRSSCGFCGDRMSDDDSVYSDYHEESYCSHCIDNNFTEAIYRVRDNGRRVTTYVRSNQTERDCNGNDWLSDIIGDYLAFSDDDSKYHVESCGCSSMETQEACDGEIYTGSDRDSLTEDSDGVYHVEHCDCEEVKGAHYEHDAQMEILAKNLAEEPAPHWCYRCVSNNCTCNAPRLGARTADESEARAEMEENILVSDERGE